VIRFSAERVKFGLRPAFENAGSRRAGSLRDGFSPGSWRSGAARRSVGLKVNGLAAGHFNERASGRGRMRDCKTPASRRKTSSSGTADADLERAGFRVATRQDHMRCFGNDTLGYEEELAIYGSVGSCLSKTLTQYAMPSSLPVLKDHGIAGVTMALKNMFGAIHNPNKYHSTSAIRTSPTSICCRPFGKKSGAHCDATTAQYEGGPSTCAWTWPYNGLLMSRDPGLGLPGLAILEQKGRERHEIAAAIGRAPITSRRRGCESPLGDE